MSNNKDILDVLGVYIWVALVGFIGGILNIGTSPHKSTGHKWLNLIVGILSSMFCGWISFEIILYAYGHERLALATCGFFAWKGADWANVLADKAVDKFLDAKLKTKEYDEYNDYIPPKGY